MTLPPLTPQPTALPPLLAIDGLSQRFAVRKGFWNRVTGHVHAVNQVSLTMQPGETLGLVGESGCGKSTLGRSVLQLLRPSEGSVRLNGQELTTLSQAALRPLRQHMQMVFQNPYASLNPRMTVGQALQEPFQIHQPGTKAKHMAKVAQLLDQVGLPKDSVQRYPHEFSGGQRQRICIARAIALNPQLVVADEPVSALDVSIQAQILNLMQDLRQQLGLAYLFVSHNLGVVRYISDRVAVMYLGRIVELAPVEQLFATPLHPYTQALLAAAPVADPTAPRQTLRLQGDLPSPINPPSGCAFHTRCPVATEQCKQAVPPFIAHAPGHFAACFHLPSSVT
jgi:peptide/nickel transport system ATP-binding protein